MMNYSLKQQPNPSGYKSIPHASGADEDTTAAVPLFVATILPRMVAGGAVWMPDQGHTTTTAIAMNLVVPTTTYATRCIPAAGTFGGVSTHRHGTQSFQFFQTCFRDEERQYFCWTQSYCDDWDDGTACHLYKPCMPDGNGWHPVPNDDLQYNNPVTHPYFCGGPCQDVQVYTS